jgi:hypothetical protein
MKKIIAITLLSFLTVAAWAQEEEDKAEEKKGGFKKDHLFTGGSLTASFSGNTLAVGAAPVLGYSINRFLDVGVQFSFLYYSNRHVEYVDGNGYYYYSDDKYRQTNFGPGAFVKFYPLRFLFIQAQGELNFINQKYIYADGYPSERSSVSAPSLLLGAGYASGREGVGNLFYYISIAVDVIGDRNSPYVEALANGRKNLLPVLRAGLQVPLFQGKKNRQF